MIRPATTINRIHNPAGTRERLLDTAERLFAERGFTGTSVRRIADAAGANLGAINYHFRSKEKLYAEVFTRRIAQLRDTILAGTPVPARSSRDLAKTLHAFGRAFLAPHRDPAVCTHLHRLFTREMIEACLPPGTLARELVNPTIDAIAYILRQSRPRMSSATARACAHSYFVLLVHIVKGARANTGAHITATTADQQLDHVVRFTTAAVRSL
ncbi:MAG: TetR/AcrR family transcriptional regulator [Vicinamibacteria bacterium]|jgi:AcrR family transcriptional regulator|nr:TetR/AcrR family transcriptional regulator [Vicinamibacteria bacterium]